MAEKPADVQRLERRLAKAEALFRQLSEQHRDRLWEAVMGGLAVRYAIDGETSPQRLAQAAGRLVEAAMRERELWAKGFSVNQTAAPKPLTESPFDSVVTNLAERMAANGKAAQPPEATR